MLQSKYVVVEVTTTTATMTLVQYLVSLEPLLSAVQFYVSVRLFTTFFHFSVGSGGQMLLFRTPDPRLVLPRPPDLLIHPPGQSSRVVLLVLQFSWPIVPCSPSPLAHPPDPDPATVSLGMGAPRVFRNSNCAQFKKCSRAKFSL